MSQSILDEVPSHARPNADRVKNKTPAKVQITAEQLLREAWERKESAPAKIPKLQIADRDELLEYQRNERKTFEMRIVRNRSHTPIWIRYARWEEDQDEFVRARSIWERAIDNDYRNPVVWLNYAEMEMRHRFVNHARNVFDRAVALLPRADNIWLKYAHMEEMLGRIDLARLVYQRWLKWFPKNTAYFSFIRFELRHGKEDNARHIYSELVVVHPTAQSYIKFAKFEERHEQYGRTRHVYERASEELSADQQTPGLFIAFAKFEERRKQPHRARAIYKFALTKFIGDANTELDRSYTSFEKQHGDREALDEMLISKKREALETMLKENPTDYDAWFDLIQLEDETSPSVRIREVYERAVQTTPPFASKAAWSLYIYLWLGYAAWTELSQSDLPGALDIYKRCIDSIPNKHRSFSFGKIWVYYAHAELRNKDVAAARRIFGAGLGVLPQKKKLYREYIEMERALGEMDRVREIFEVWLSRNPTNGSAFLEFAELELELGETERARHILELASEIPGLDDEKTVWKKLAEVTASTGDDEMAVRRFEVYLLSRPEKLVWESYIVLLKELGSPTSGLRRVFEKATRSLKDAALSNSSYDESAREDALEIGEKWLKWEEDIARTQGDEIGQVEKVKKTIAKRVKRTRNVSVADGEETRASKRVKQQSNASVDGGEETRAEEYWRIVFPEENVSAGLVSNKLLDAARRWKLGLGGNTS